MPAGVRPVGAQALETDVGVTLAVPLVLWDRASLPVGPPIDGFVRRMAATRPMDDLPAGAAGLLGARNEAARIVREIRGGPVATVRISIRP